MILDAITRIWSTLELIDLQPLVFPDNEAHNFTDFPSHSPCRNVDEREISPLSAAILRKSLVITIPFTVGVLVRHFPPTTSTSLTSTEHSHQRSTKSSSTFQSRVVALSIWILPHI